MILSYSYDSGGYQLRYFRRYSLEELIEKGNEFLKGSTLTEAQRSYYGIE